MPLVVFCGPPCCGKSTLAVNLAKKMEHLELEQGRTIKVVVVKEVASSDGGGGISDEAEQGLGIDPRASVYADSKREREMRSRLKSEVEGALARSLNCVVLLDAGNYIKGFRYELFCVAKTMHHLHAVIQVEAPVCAIRTWNKLLPHYPDELLSDLLARFETPNPAQRWDSPLFRFRQAITDNKEEEEECVVTFEPEDIDEAMSTQRAGLKYAAHAQLLIDGDVGQLAECLLACLVRTHCSAKPNQSVLPATLCATNFLQDLDRTCQHVIDHILACQSVSADYADLPPRLLMLKATTGKRIFPRDNELRDGYENVDGAAPTTNVPQLTLIGRATPYTVVELTRAKRRFIACTRAKPPSMTDMNQAMMQRQIACLFLRFLST